MYSKGLNLLFSSRQRIYHGVWGGALFQQVYHLPPTFMSSLPMMPEWYVIIGILLISSLMGMVWTPMLLAVPILCLMLGYELQQAVAHSARSTFHDHYTKGFWAKLRMRCVMTILYRMQPMARLIGRYRNGLVPWRLRGVSGFSLPQTKPVDIAKKKWKVPSEWLEHLESTLRSQGACVLRGGDFDSWDLELRGGMLGAVRLRLMTEDLEYGSQLLRFRTTTRCSLFGKTLIGVTALLASIAIYEHSAAIAVLFSILLIGCISMLIRECCAATATFLRFAEEAGTT